jgi:4-amino-4-deoxy-L-arabinose transferase-like glycosyltransferase
MSAPKKRSALITAGWIATFVFVMFFHVWRISEIPNGLFLDETAIGYNAARIAETARDEYGKFMPVIFTSFGDAKSPLYIYSAAAMFTLFPQTDTVLRLTSTAFFFLTLLGMWLLLRHLFPKRREVWLFGLMATGFLPWLFTLSRMSFEVVSQPAITVLALLAAHSAFAKPSDKKAVFASIASGFLFGLSVHTYPTARLLSFVFFAAVLFLFLNKGSWRRCAWMTGAFSVAVSPFVVYTLMNPGGATSRFRFISVFHNRYLSLPEKIGQFAENYVAHADPGFLLMHGDLNLRHATGYGGQLFWIVFALACVGIAIAFVHKKTVDQRFHLLSVLLLCLAPVASAFTNEAIPHALRSALLAPMFLILACYGYAECIDRCRPAWRHLVIGLVTGVLLVESAFYVNDYFSRYARVSAYEFQSYGLRESIQLAFEQKPKQVLLSHTVDYTLYEWYARQLDPEQRALFSFGEVVPLPQACVLSLPEEAWRLEGSPSRNLTIPGSIVHLRCF